MSDTLNVRLISAPPRAHARIWTEAIAATSRRLNMSHLDLEERCTIARSAVVHLAHNDSSYWKLYDGIEDLIKHTEVLLQTPGVEKISRDPRWADKLRVATDDLARVSAEDKVKWQVSREEIRLLIEVVDVCRATYLSRGYDPSSILSGKAYALAQLIQANFAAYEATLNH